MKLKLFLFYLFTSSAIALGVYYLIKMSNDRVFGSLYRMYLYHYSHPIGYILIATFSFSLVAMLFTKVMQKVNIFLQILYTLMIFLLSVILSSPLGGMLWHIHDMRVGYFPSNFLEVIVMKGTAWGLGAGWIIVSSSMPYNIIVAFAFFILIQLACRLPFFKSDSLN